MKKVLIFGYSGFVGPYLAEEFLKDNYEVFGSDIIEPSKVLNVSFSKSNILDFESVNKLINDIKPDVIANLAAISSVEQSWKNPQLTMSINVVGALNILESIKNMDVKPRVLFVGSSEEYQISGKPLNEKSKIDASNPYGLSKISQEEFANMYRERFGIKVFCVRAFNHTGIGQKDSFVLPSFCKQVAEIEKTKKPGKIFVGNLSAKRDFSDVRDVTNAYKKIVESDDTQIVYNVGSGKAYSIKELLDFIISLSTQKIDVIVDPIKLRPIDNPYICADPTLLISKLNWSQKHNIKDTLKEMFDYYLNK